MALPAADLSARLTQENQCLVGARGHEPEV
jgi:hypothetical protein